MRDGDLSNEVVPRLLLVWEGAIAFCTDEKKEQHYLGKQNFQGLAGIYTANDLMISKMWDVTKRQSVTMDVITYYPAGFIPPLEQWLEDEGVPYGACWSADPQVLARKLAHMPDVARVYDPDPQRAMAYGSKGIWLTSVHQLGAL